MFERARRFIPWTTWAIVALALALRLAWLPLRPPHSDEGVNGWFAERVLAEGFYSYDPENYHGPLHYYLLAVARLLLGRNLWSLRLPTVLFGVGAVWLACRCGDALGRRVAWMAALFMAVSPALVLYSRWAIHESELLFFSLLALRGWCRWRARPGRLAVWEVAAGLAGALATKEVWVVHAAAAFAAWWVWHHSRRLVGEPLVAPSRPPWRWVVLPVLACLGALALLYSGFGRDPEGLTRFFAPFAIWTTRAMQGAGHEKPWHYWIELFARYEPAALVGLILSPWAAVAARPPVRQLALYGMASFAAYTVIAYKTPWCVVELVWPFTFVAGWALARLAVRARPSLAAALAGALTIASLVPAVRVNFFRYADATERYVYVQTIPGALLPVRLLERAAAGDPTLHDAPIQVVMKLSWPLPWLLSDFRHVGHWHDDQLPSGDSAVLFVDDNRRADVEPLLHRRYFVVPFKLSPAHAQASVYFDAERFAGVRPARSRTFVPTPPPAKPAASPSPSATRKTR